MRHKLRGPLVALSFITACLAESTLIVRKNTEDEVDVLFPIIRNSCKALMLGLGGRLLDHNVEISTTNSSCSPSSLRVTLFEEERQDDVQRHVYHDGDCEHSCVLSEANARPSASTAVFKVQSSCSTSVVLRLQRKVPSQATAGTQHRELADVYSLAPAPGPSGSAVARALPSPASGPARVAPLLAPAPSPAGIRVRTAFFGTLGGAAPAPQAPGPSAGTSGSALRNLFWGAAPVLDGSTMVVPVIVDPLVHVSGGDGSALRYSNGGADQSSQSDQDMSQMLGNGQFRVQCCCVRAKGYPVQLQVSSSTVLLCCCLDGSPCCAAGAPCCGGDLQPVKALPSNAMCDVKHCTAIILGAVMSVVVVLIAFLLCVCRMRMRAMPEVQGTSLRSFMWHSVPGGRRGDAVRSRRPAGTAELQAMPTVQLRALPVRTPSVTKAGDNQDCPICLESLPTQAMVKFTCNHCTCRRCYKTLMKDSSRDIVLCPLCRAPLVEVLVIIPPPTQRPPTPREIMPEP